MRTKSSVNTQMNRQRILNCAEQILLQDGLKGLSIRQIASRLNNTPGNIYHYFRGKDEILCCIVERGYLCMVELLQSTADSFEFVEEQLCQTLSTYIHYMISNRELFMILFMQDIPVLRDQVSILHRGVSQQRSSLLLLSQNLRRGKEEGKYSFADEELAAQNIWTATYGLISRMILEQVDAVQMERLIQNHLTLVLQAIQKKGEDSWKE